MSKKQGSASRGALSKNQTLRLTPEMHAHLVQIAGGERAISDVIRAAIRRYLDEHDEVRTNKAHFTRSFRERIDRIDDEQALTHWYLTILIILLAQIGAAMLNRLPDTRPPGAVHVAGPALLDNAVAVIDQGGGEPIRQQMDDVIIARIDRLNRQEDDA